MVFDLVNEKKNNNKKVNRRAVLYSSGLSASREKSVSFSISLKMPFFVF